MTQHPHAADIDPDDGTAVWSVERFCKQYRVEPDEKERLHLLFGQSASKAELLMNARRSPVFR